MQVVITQCVEKLNRTKRQMKEEFAILLELGHPSSPAFRQEYFAPLPWGLDHDCHHQPFP